MKFKQVLAMVAMGSFLAAPLYAATNQKQIETIVHDYIIKNPEVVVQSLQNYQQKQMEQTQKSFKKIQVSAPKYSDQLFHKAGDPVAGNLNGSLTIVEFFDYQCPHCVDMAPVIEDLIKKNGNLRVVFKEFPIRGKMSEIAAKAALASQLQGKYYEFHNALMGSKVEPLTEDAIYNIAQTVGLDVNKLKADMKTSAIEQQIKDTYKLAEKLEIMFTPVFFIAKSNINAQSSPDAVAFIPGGVGEDALSEAITKISNQ